jgi:hypothetical protein
VTIEALLRALVAALRAEAIPFMVTGSVAGGYHGVGRATMDVDLVIDPDRARLDAFLARVAALGAYVSDEAAREALARRTMFNVVDPESGWKADLIIRKARPFSEEEFRRRQSADYFGLPVDVATVEDVILSKLEWAKLGGSARQLEDVRALLRVAGDEIDHAYLRRWVDGLGVREQWEAATAASRGPGS